MKEFKKVSESETILTELMIPSYSNFGGKIHGGVILSLMDKVAYICAAKHADAYCVTAAIERVDFLASVEVGDLVSLLASVNYTGNSSLVVGIRVISENIKTRQVKHTNTSYFTMVAFDDDKKTVKVPGLILENQKQIHRFHKGLLRKKLKTTYEGQENSLVSMDTREKYKEALKNERCVFQILD